MLPACLVVCLYIRPSVRSFVRKNTICGLEMHLGTHRFSQICLFSISSQSPQGTHLGLKWVCPKVGDELADLRVEQTTFCKRSAKWQMQLHCNHRIHSMPRAWAAVSKCQLLKLSLVCVCLHATTTSIILLYNLTLRGWFGLESKSGWYKQEPDLTITILKFVNHKTNVLLWAFIKLL